MQTRKQLRGQSQSQKHGRKKTSAYLLFTHYMRLIMSTNAAQIPVAVSTTLLSNGCPMPNLGLGLGAWQSADDAEELEEAVDIALEMGYRHFDTSPPNDKSIGNVLKRWLDSGRIKREELFIVSKLPMTGMWPYRVNEYIRQSLQALQLDFVDLYLIQFPVGFHYPEEEETGSPTATSFHSESHSVILEKATHLESIWRAMENEIKVGRAKAIGVCDFNREQLKRILGVCKVPPAVLQMEVNVYSQQNEMRAYCKEKGIAISAYAPLGRMDITDHVDTSETKGVGAPTQDPVITALARKHGRTPSQIILSFLIQSNIAVVPKCLNQFDIKSNIKVCGFKLEAAEMKAIEGLDKGEEGHVTKAVFTEIFTGVEAHPEYPWKN